MPNSRLKLLPREQRHDRSVKIFVIATEGAKTEKQYVDLLRLSPGFDGTKIHVEVLPAVKNDSAPRDVLARLDALTDQYDLDLQRDELWALVDVDAWGDANLSAINRLCKQKRYRHAVSNPCFELWLLLHHEAAGGPFRDCGEVEGRIRAVVGEYNKAHLKAAHYPPTKIDDAIQRAHALDSQSTGDWPASTGTHVYRLVQALRTASSG